ncbi:uncharacterized protein LOC130986073 [Salvia miltiorrhiza]|uniref:uncharacterized protein LOC130986073 n=1 Tax=Salvia miltiorrhiza TaxID=226208 RepID=UPI0025AC2BEB|nr:uncharacterized protein LOC130986073 [Salvia miltiorrhiza]
MSKARPKEPQTMRSSRASLSSILQPVFSLRPKSFCSAAPPKHKHKPQTPLHLRPPAFRVTLSDLKQWHAWAKTQASSVGSTFSALDGGPDSDLLLRELKWLVEDAVEHPALLDGGGAAQVAIRARLEELYELWRQRIQERRPFQYVVGCEHWRDLILSVEEGVLIPRPETETIVDLVGDAVKADGELREGLWADLGTGSGALAIAVARVLGGGGRVVAVDLSSIAAAVAGYNVERYCLQGKVSVRVGSWFEGVEGELRGLVSNPPYIPSQHIHALQAEVSRHEPVLALDGGLDGMDHLIHLSNGAASMLKPRGFFAFETNGETQSKFLVDYMTNQMKGRFCRLKIASDFAGIQRFVTGYKA